MKYRNLLALILLLAVTQISSVSFAGVWLEGGLSGTPSENQAVLGRSFSTCVQNLYDGRYECQNGIIQSSEFFSQLREFYLNPGLIRISVSIEGKHVFQSDRDYLNYGDQTRDASFAVWISSASILRAIAPVTSGSISLCFVAGSYPIAGVHVFALGTTIVSDATGCIRSPSNLPFGSYQVTASKDGATISGTLIHDRNGKVYIYDAIARSLTAR